MDRRRTLGQESKERSSEKDEDRIVVRTEGGVTSIHYRGADPETRYRPREPSVWWEIRESFRLGGRRSYSAR